MRASSKGLIAARQCFYRIGWPTGSAKTASYASLISWSKGLICRCMASQDQAQREPGDPAITRRFCSSCSFAAT